MLKSFISNTTKFKHDDAGGIAIMFGLSATALCMMIGLAIDLGRTYSSKEKIAAAIDAASLAAAKAIRLEGLDQDEATALAKRVFAENMKNGAANWTDVHNVNVVIDTDKHSARVEVDASVRTTFGALAGISKMGSSGSGAAIFESRDVEVAVQLDMTGSMCWPSCDKINALKTATTNLVDILLPVKSNGQIVRVGFAPFAAGVNVGSHYRTVNGDRAGSGNKCVYERQSTMSETMDVAPVGLDAYKIKEDLVAPPAPKGLQDCPKAELVPLTKDAKVLNGEIAKFEASGSTAGQLGAAWAWNLISDKWAGIWPADSKPAAYGSNTDKIVILMTDGVYNTIGGVYYDDSSSEAALARSMSVDLCTNMKELGVTVYTVGFMLDSIDAENTLKACAGKKGHPNPELFFFNTSTGTELNEAFKNIANTIMRLRLTN